MKKSKSSQNKSTGINLVKAFTLVELLVSVGIFAFMTSLMVAKYGTFNQSVLLTNLAYDVAVTIRTAQSYGLSVKGASEGVDANKFQSGYGVYFDTTNMTTDNKFFLYSDSGSVEGLYDPDDEVVEQYNLKRGATIKWVCEGSVSCANSNSKEQLDISFKRPDPSANIYFDGNPRSLYPSARIVIKGTDDSTREVIVRENGQISVGQ